VSQSAGIFINSVAAFELEVAFDGLGDAH
jgi:hypothetical protein